MEYCAVWRHAQSTCASQGIGRRALVDAESLLWRSVCVDVFRKATPRSVSQLAPLPPTSNCPQAIGSYLVRKPSALRQYHDVGSVCLRHHLLSAGMVRRVLDDREYEKGYTDFTFLNPVVSVWPEPLECERTLGISTQERVYLCRMYRIGHCLPCDDTE